MKKTSSPPAVSIIIPTYDSEKTLPDCLKSIQNQSYKSFEVIIIDNFSSDNTLKIAEKFGAKIIQQKGNPALARNLGITESTGKYVFFIDSDQILSPSIVEECVSICEAKNVGMIKIPEIFIGKGFWGSCSAAWKNCFQKVGQKRINQNFFEGEPRFFVKEDIVQAGMFNIHLLWGEDHDLHQRMAKMNIKEAMCKAKIYHHEPVSIKNILLKTSRYGETMSTFTKHTHKRVFRPLFTRSLLTLAEVAKQYRQYPLIIMGCAVLLFLKVYATNVGLLTNLELPKRKT